MWISSLADKISAKIPRAAVELQGFSTIRDEQLRHDVGRV